MNANNADAIFNAVSAFVMKNMKDPAQRNYFLLKLAKAIEKSNDTPIGPWLKCLELGIFNIGAADSNSGLTEITKMLERYLVKNLGQPDIATCAHQKCLYIIKNKSRPRELVRVTMPPWLQILKI